MTARKLKVAPGLSLDPDYIGAGTLAILAKKGAGKSYLARILAEEFWAARVPFVLMDPMGTSWGLRVDAGGEGEGIPVPIFGGAHGDAPLERRGGELIADLVVDEGLSMVLDMSDLGNRTAEREFALAFFERLYRRNSDLVHVLIDEADLFAPQKPQAGDRQLLGMTENIVRRGRNRGIGISLMTQRPAVLNKDVLTQLDVMVAMRTVGLTDRQAIDAWVKGHGEDEEQAEEVKKTLAHLGNGECWWWIPELGILEKAQVRRSKTFDSSPSRKRGKKHDEPKTFADVDMGAIEKKMTQTIERAKAEDPKELRKVIRELETELKKRPTETKEVEKEVPVPVLGDGALAKLEKQIGKLEASSRPVAEVLEGIRADLRKLDNGRAPAPRPRRRAEAVTPRREEGRVRPSRPVSAEPAGPPPDGDVHLKEGMVRMLRALAQVHPERLTRVQAATLSDISPKSGTVSDYVTALKRGGYVIEENGGIELTKRGEERVADSIGTGAPSVQEIRDLWAPKLKDGMIRMLDVLIEIHPDGISRAELAEEVGISPGSGTVSDYVTKLKRNMLAEERSRQVYAGEVLFIGGRG